MFWRVLCFDWIRMIFGIFVRRLWRLFGMGFDLVVFLVDVIFLVFVDDIDVFLCDLSV